MSDTSKTTEQRISDLAYAMWQKEGQPEGRTEEFWHRARSQVASEDNADTAPLMPALTSSERDQQLEQTFPASDPVSPGVIVGPER